MIRVLDKHVADKIAAGEVIDRPISIVKELVENSLDADATSITVEIRGGGKEYIRVTDDGCGIDEKYAEIAFSRHATSKIRDEKDLDAIGTLGFRGEALASIAAVARVEMITSTEDETPGRSLRIDGGTIVENKPIGCPRGTTITVRDLFYNVPARLKFLASENGESRRITDMMSRIALAYPDVRFRLINGGRDVFSTAGSGNILDNILRIYGRDLEKDLLPVDFTRDGSIIRGYVSKPSLSTSTRSRQYFCVNGRVVSSKTVEKGLEKGYRERLFTGRHPVAFLFISVPAKTVDVNVHPTKKEIRFNDPFAVEDMVEEGVRKALSAGEAVASLDAKATKDTISQQAKEPAASVGETDQGVQVDVKNLLKTLRSSVEEDGMDYIPEIPREEGVSEEPERLDITSMDIVGVVLDTYIITTLEDTMYLIDQHAAHERVLYESLLTRYESEESPSQTLLTPLQFTVSAETSGAENEWIPALRRMGYDIEPFGDKVYIVRQVPASLGSEEAEAFVRQFVMDLEDKPDIRDHADLERLIMRSCKSAVKGGDRLHQAEIRSLLEQLDSCDNPYSCPHGRPVFVKMTRYELERMFKRA